MVKKIGGKSRGAKQTSAVSPSKKVEGTKVRGVEQVAETTGSDIQGVDSQFKPKTREEKERLFQLIQEEADKLFGPDGLPEEKRASIEGAVKMAIDAGIIVEEELDEN